MTEQQPATAPAIVLDRPDVDWIRDGYGRPIILPDPRWRTRLVEPSTGELVAPPSWYGPDGTLWPDRRYTRVTTFGEALLDGSALSRWKMRRVALGMGRRPDYVTAAAALTAEDRDRQALNDLAEKALEAAGPNAADIGTALHQFTERMDRGEDLGFVPPEYRADLDAYRQAVEPLTMLHRECRMVCDQLETAGTPDAIVLCSEPDPDGVTDMARIADLKTGNVDYTAGKFSTQLAIYAHSALYDPATGARTYPDRPLNVRWGLVVHMPAGLGTAQLRWLRLDHGWAGAQLAGPVREWRKPGARELSRPVFLPAGVQWSADGKCQGTKRDGGRCTYRALDNGFCSRHQAQAPGEAPVVRGDAATIPDPVLETEALENRAEDALQQQAVQAASTAVEPAVDPVGWQGARMDELDAALAADRAEHPSTAVEPAVDADAILAADQQPATAPLQLDRPDPDPADVPGGAAFGPMDIPEDDPEQQRWLAEQAESQDAADLDGTDDVPELPAARCDLTDLPVDQCGCTKHRPDLAAVGDDGVELHYPDRDDTPDPDLTVESVPAVRDLLPPLPYRADPMDPHQLQGNPRPVSRMGTPWDAEQAARDAEQSLLAQVAGCRSRTELNLLWEATGPAWTDAVRAAAAERAVAVDRLPQMERTAAALWSAIRNAPTEGHLLQLWQDQSLNPLWTDAHRAAAAARQAELRGA